MDSFFRRRRRLLLGVAAGAAGAAAAYYWWTGYTNTKIQQQRSVEMELSAILRGAGALQGGAEAGDGALTGAIVADGEGADADGDDCGSPDLDESLDSHFNYIQKVSAPQELTNLLPRIQANLFRLTDVTLVKQLQLQQQQQHQQQEQPEDGSDPADGPSGGGAAAAATGSGAQGQLRLLARLCFGRTVAAAFLLPLMDLVVRTKLNIIGRHLFLQEKFSKLRQPAAPAARMRLPPRLTAAAVESFLSCEQLAEGGAAWLVEQAMAAADRVLEDTPLDTYVTPEELAGLVQAMATSLGQAVTATAATSATGSAWVDAVVGPAGAAAAGVDAVAAAGSAEAYRRALASAAMVEELEAELRRVLSNYRFGEALHAAVGQCLSTSAAHIHATFIAQAAAAVTQPPPPPPSWSQPQQQADAQTSHPLSPQSKTWSPEQQPLPQPHPSPRMVSPFSAVSGGTAVEAGDAADEDAAAGLAASAPPGTVTSFGSAQAGDAPSSPLNRPSSGTSGTAAQATYASAAGSMSAFSATSCPSPHPTQRQQSLALTSPPRPRPSYNGGSGGGGSCISGGGLSGISRKASLAAAAVAAMQPRPLARCLRAVQGACEPLFVDAKEVTARIAVLPPVMSLCAVAFAAPLEL